MTGWHLALAAGVLCMAVRLAPAEPPDAAPKTEADFTKARERMVDTEIVAAGVKNPRVIDSMRTTPRHQFMPISDRANAYLDMALPIGEGQTISPPFIVAYMTEQLDPRPTDRVLEIGTGSGYQAAVLSPLVKDVYSIEIVKKLGDRAARTLKNLGYKNVHTRVGDGYQGWPEAAPFDKIVVTCSPEKVPQALVDELKEGGRMLVPVGERYQQTLYLFEKKQGKLESIALLPTLFVPMTGQAEDRRAVKPDPLNPAINNGGFEQATDDVPVGWHYQRQLKRAESQTAPEGKHFVTFDNAVPGLGAQALQGLAVDGRKVHQVQLSAWVKGKDIRRGRSDFETASIYILFYDERRAPVGRGFLGPFRGTFDWRRDSDKIDVPQQAREAIINIGLRGAVGELSLDDVELKPVKRQPQPAASDEERAE